MSYQFNRIVNRQEASALKEMIFNRARERAQSMSQSEQADIMEIARESFVSKNNPFSQIINQPSQAKVEVDTITANAPQTKVIDEPEVKEPETVNEDIGFPQRKLESQYTPRAIQQNKVIAEQVSASTIYNNMNDAREGLSRKKGFMGALEFLNSQAAVSLARTRADRFEMIV